MGITVLGPLTVDGSGRLGPRDRVVLQALTTRQGQPVSPDELVDALWGDHPPASSAKNLQSCIVRLRKALGSEAIVTSAHGYALVLPPDRVDSRRFEEQVDRARELLAIGEADRVAFLLEQALALWRGSAFPDLPDWPPAQREAERLEVIRQEAEEMYVDALLRSGRPRETLARGHAMVSAAPLRERRWELLALAQYQVGAQGEALRTIRQLRTVLARELGIDPSPDMLALEQAILRQDVNKLVPRPRVGQPQCPWLGLRAYDLDDADRFFGRGKDIEDCLALLLRTSFIALVGPSGSGKSSILRAGVLAALRNRGHKIVVITPGRRPLESLTALPDDAGDDTVLAVDQAEEVFLLCEDPDERRSFLQRLAGEAAHRLVLVTIRGDWLTHATEHPGFQRRVEQGLHLVGTLDEEGLRDAIEGPARQAGLIIEPGLVDLLVGEVRDDPGALPLLSHAVVETWKRREGNTLTVDGYHATGGIRGAVAQSAEHLYAQIGTGQRHLLRDLVLRLVSPSIDGEAVRIRVPRRLISADDEHDQLIEMLVGARLVTSDQGVLEITHEALARAWPRLRGWLDDDVEGQRIRHHLSGAADAWNSLGRPASELYRGVRLTRALDWALRTDSTLTENEHEFLAAARAANEAEEQIAAERARAQSRLISRLRVVLAGAVVLLILVIAAGGIAGVQSDRASDNAARARANETAAEARKVGARALVTDDIDESMLLAVAGLRLDDSPDTLDNLLAALARHPELMASTQMSGAPVSDFDVSPDGRTVATYDELNHVRVYEISTGELLAEHQAGTGKRPGGTSRSVVFSPDGRTLAVGQVTPARQPIALLDASTLEPQVNQLRGQAPGRWQLRDLAFSGDGRRLAASMSRVLRAGNETRTTASTWAAVWDLGEPLRLIDRIRVGPKGGVALSPDGITLFTTRPLVIHDLATGTSTAVDRAEPVARVTVSPDGQLLAGASERGGVVLLDTTTGGLVKELSANGEFGWFTSFSRNGRRVATVSPGTREGFVWNVRTGALLAQPALGTNGDSVDLGADGSTLYTAGSDSSLRQWDLDGERRFIAKVTSTKQARLGWQSDEQPYPAPGGERVAFVSEEQVRFFDVDTGAAGPSLDRGTGADGKGSWHPDAIHFALATGDEITIWDSRSGKVVTRNSWPGRQPTTIDFSTDGGRLVVAELSGRLTMLDSTTLAPVGLQVQLDRPVCCLSAGPDHQAVVLTGPLDTSGFWKFTSTGWALVDLDSGGVVDEGDLENGEQFVEFSPDGRHAAFAGREGRVLVLDLLTGDAARGPVLGHNDYVNSLAYSPDGQRILTAGGDSYLALWDASTGLLMARVPVPQPAMVAAFRTDPDSVLSVAVGMGPVYEWNTDIAHAVDFACRLAGRGFTRVEWAAQFGTRAYQETCPDG